MVGDFMTMMRTLPGIISRSGAAPPATPDFHALTPDTGNNYLMKGVLTGTGTLTTTHTSVLYAPDFNGVYQKFPANAPVWSGGRCVLTGAAGTNVVTVHGNDAPAGTPLAEMPYLQYYPAATNSCLASQNIVNSTYWDVNDTVRAYDQVGLTGAPNTATILTDNSAVAFLNVGQAVYGMSGTFRTAVFYIKKTTGTLPWPSFQLWNGADSGSRIVVDFDTNTGAGDKRTAIGLDATDWEAVDLGDWWKVMLYIQKTNLNSRSDIYIYPAVANGTTTDVAFQRSITIGNVELHAGKTIAEVRGLGPIFTTTAAVSTDATVYSLNTANMANDNSLYWEGNTSGYGSEQQYLSTGTGGGTYIHGHRFSGASQFAYVGGTINPGVTLPINTPVKVASVGFTGTSDGVCNVGGVYSTAVTNYAGWQTGTTFNIGAVSGRANYSFKMRNLQRYDIASYTAGKTIIDGLMA